MSRIITNVPSLLAQRVLGQQNATLTKSLERLSTGYQINRGADDPAGLIASEKLRSEKAALSAAIGNAERADQVMNIAEGGLQEVNSLLIELQSLVGESANDAGLSTQEKEANQLQVDSILQTIDRIASTTSFEGLKLLNGGFDFAISGQASTIADYQINAAKLDTGDTRDVKLVVTQSAQHGTLFLSFGVATLSTTATSGTYTFELGGAKGTREFSFGDGTILSDAVAGINTFTSVTGVSAALSANIIVLKSNEFGSNDFVSFKLKNDAGQTGQVMVASSTDEDVARTASASTFANNEGKNAIIDAGQDIGGSINGAAVTGDGKTAKINTDFLALELTLTDAGAQALASIDAFTITGGGAKFNLGPNVDINSQVSIGLNNVAARNLGVTGTGFLDDLAQGQSANVVNGNLESAQEIVNKAIDQVSSLRGRIGAFQKNVVGATIRSLGVALENTSAAESAIRDTDFAAETAELTRAQILVNAAGTVLAIANSRPQAVLQLLG